MGVRFVLESWMLTSDQEVARAGGQVEGNMLEA